MASETGPNRVEADLLEGKGEGRHGGDEDGRKGEKGGGRVMDYEDDPDLVPRCLVLRAASD